MSYLDVVIGFDSAGGVIDVLTTDEGDRFALEQSRDCSGNDCVLHFALKFVEKYSQKFLQKIKSTSILLY